MILAEGVISSGALVVVARVCIVSDNNAPMPSPPASASDDEERLPAFAAGDGSNASRGFHPQTSLSANGFLRVASAPVRDVLPASAAPIMARLTRLGDACAGRAYAPGVIPNRQTRVAASGGVLLALVGLFIGHTLEYLRVWGPAGIVASMTNPVHAYMLPVAGVLLALGAVFGLRLARAWEGIERAARSRSRRRAPDPGADEPQTCPAVERRRSSSGTRLAAIWLPLATVQISALRRPGEHRGGGPFAAGSRPGGDHRDPLGRPVRPPLRVAAARLRRAHLRDSVPPSRSRRRKGRGAPPSRRPSTPDRSSCHPPSRRPHGLAARPAGTAPLAKATTTAPRRLTVVRELGSPTIRSQLEEISVVPNSSSCVRDCRGNARRHGDLVCRCVGALRVHSR